MKKFNMKIASKQQVLIHHVRLFSLNSTNIHLRCRKIVTPPEMDLRQGKLLQPLLFSICFTHLKAVAQCHRQSLDPAVNPATQSSQ